MTTIKPVSRLFANVLPPKIWLAISIASAVMAIALLFVIFVIVALPRI